MIVTFCGHSDVESLADVQAWLLAVTESLISEGADIFYLGGYGSFDTLCTSVLKEQKAHFPNIQLILITPYLNALKSDFAYDDIIYPPIEKTPPRYAILKRNRWMVDRSDVVVSYIIHSWGGAAKTLTYAKQKKKRIINYIQ